MWPLQVFQLLQYIASMFAGRYIIAVPFKPPLVCAPGCLHRSSLAWHGERWNLFSFCNFARSTRPKYQRTRRSNSTLPILAAGTHARFNPRPSTFVRRQLNIFDFRPLSACQPFLLVVSEQTQARHARRDAFLPRIPHMQSHSSQQ